MCNPWSGLVRPGGGGGEGAPADLPAAASPAHLPAGTEWHGLPVTRVPLEWSGTVAGNPRPMVLTQGQYDCLMSLRLRFPITVVPPTQANDGPVGGVFGYTHRTVSALLKHGLIRKSAGGGYSITDNGLHAVYRYKPRA